MNAVERTPDNIAVECRGLTRRLGNRYVLNNVDLTVSKGSVLGLYGPNGAGKTTILQHVVGALRPQSGKVSVLGQDPTANPVGVLSRLGYLPEADNLPGDMILDDLLWYVRNMYEKWDSGYAEQLRQRFELDRNERLSRLSRGQRAQVQLIAAVAFRPDLLVLDAPSSILDADFRKAMLREIIPVLLDNNGAVLIASHLYEEIVVMSDRVITLEKGNVQDCLDVDQFSIKYGSVDEKGPDEER